MLKWGDFNLIRSVQDKSSGQGDQRLINAFNGFIGNFSLRELHGGTQRMRLYVYFSVHLGSGCSSAHSRQSQIATLHKRGGPSSNTRGHNSSTVIRGQ